MDLPPASLPITRPITRVDLNPVALAALRAAEGSLRVADGLLGLQGCSATDDVRFAVRCALGNVAQAVEKIAGRPS